MSNLNVVVLCILQCLKPDPILQLQRIVGFGGSSMRDVSRLFYGNMPVFHKSDPCVVACVVDMRVVLF